MKEEKLKIVHNSSGNLKEPETESNSELYKILDKLPKPLPKFNLTASQKYWWYWFGNEFLSTNNFATLDQTHLQKAAIWLDFRNQAIKIINELGYENGLVQTFRGGAQNISAHLTVLEKADKHLEEVSSHFGLSFKDRNKLKMPAGESGQLDMFDEWMKLQTVKHAQ